MLEREVLSPVGIGVETERKSSIGVALVIVVIDPSRNGENVTQPRLWTIREKRSKPATGRIAGQISLPGETRKTGSTIEDAVIGGLAGEFSGDEDLIGRLSKTPSWFVPGRIRVEGNPFDLAIVIFRQEPGQEIKPLDNDEVAPNSWMTMEEIQKIDPHQDPRIVREFVHQVIHLERSEGLITRAILEHERGLRDPLSSILPEGFNSKEFFSKRETVPDTLIPQKNGE